MNQNDKRVGATQIASANQPEDDGATKKAPRADTEVAGKVNAAPDQIDKSGSTDESAPQTNKPA